MSLDSQALVDMPVLDFLLHHPNYCDYSLLSKKTNQTLTTIKASLDRLEAAGCKLDDHPLRGVKLIQTALGVWRDYLSYQCLPQKRIVEVYQQTASTQNRLRDLINAHGQKANRAIVATNYQENGRGRLGRQWHAPPNRCVLFSLACDLGDKSSNNNIDCLTFLAAVAIARAIETASNQQLSASIKWPNDVMIGQQKIAGILVETFTLQGRLTAAIGIGINVDLAASDLPTELRHLATSFKICGKEVDRLAVLASALAWLDNALALDNPATWLQEWQTRSTQLGHRIKLRNHEQIFTGQVINLDPNDGLILRTDAGTIVHLPASTTTVL